ncbi:MAG: hypothetical protein GX053_11285, partial [Tissierella sp.]|nr:hypothetical protein [Tissierella sp.]
FFLSALMERLNIGHTLVSNDENNADGMYIVTATILDEEYEIKIQGEHGETWTVNDKPPYEEIPEDSQAEKLQFQYEINKLVKEIKAEGGILKRLEATNAEITDSTDPIKPAKVTVEELKVISSKLVEYGKEIQGYEDKVVSITLQTIGVPGVDFVAIDKTIVSLRNKLTEAETKALERGRELEIEASNAAKDALNQQIIEITSALNAITTKLDEFQIESADLKSLNEIKGSLGRYEREVDGYDLRVETIEKLAESLPNTEPTIDFGETKDKITSVRDKIKEVNNKLNSALEKAANAENATKAVIDAETGVYQYLNGQITSDAIQKLVEEAKEKVNNLTNSQLKNDLNNRLNEVWVKRLAIQAVNTAVADMEDLLDKDTITKEEIADIVAKENAEYKNEITKAYFAAIEDFDAIGTALKTRIIEIQKVLDAIVVADEMDREADIKPARAIVKKIGSKYENIKNALNAYIDEKEEDIINGEANALLDDAKEAIQAAYDLLIKKFDDGDIKYSTTDITEAI